MKKIKISNGTFAIVDDEDFDRMKQYHWYGQSSKGYAVRSVRIGKYNYGIKLMHRELMGPKSAKEVVDHINGNPLDNRKSNLRICSLRENFLNQKIHKNNKCGIKGVYLNNNRWRMQITCHGKVIRRYGFETKEEAGEAYDKLAKKYFGEFAKTNN